MINIYHYLAPDNLAGELSMTSLHDFEAYLTDRRLVQKKQLPYFLRWVANYLSFYEKSASEPDNEGQVQDFLQFIGKNKEEEGRRGRCLLSF